MSRRSRNQGARVKAPKDFSNFFFFLAFYRQWEQESSQLACILKTGSPVNIKIMLGQWPGNQKRGFSLDAKLLLFVKFMYYFKICHHGSKMWCTMRSQLFCSIREYGAVELGGEGDFHVMISGPCLNCPLLLITCLVNMIELNVTGQSILHWHVYCIQIVAFYNLFFFLKLQ